MCETIGEEAQMNLKVLVIEDNQVVRSLLGRLLRKRGYGVTLSSSPILCDAYVSHECGCPRDSRCADLIISDLHLPGMTGLEFIKNQIRNRCKVPVQNMALISGDWSSAELSYALRLGCQVFWKPCRLADIHRWLDECEQRAAQAELSAD